MNFMEKITMVDLKGQYQKIKSEIDSAIQGVIDDASFIKGKSVADFEESLKIYLDCHAVIGCGNGTDALQIAMMALELKPGDEVIVPAFTYVATAEVIALLGLKPIFVDVDPDTFCIDPDKIEGSISSHTRAIVPVHLYGQSAEMSPILELAKKYSLKIIEDNAQALGANYQQGLDNYAKCGTIGDIGTTSFFPSKNLGCFGDGGALIVNDQSLSKKIRMIANHGQSKKYYHDLVGVNSRLDSIQAAVLNVKLKYLDEYASARQQVADFYDDQLDQLSWLQGPTRSDFSTHVFHQYTIKLKIDRDKFIEYMSANSVPVQIYYPLPLHMQKAYFNDKLDLPVATSLSDSVVSLPIHTEMKDETLCYITNVIKAYEP